MSTNVSSSSSSSGIGFMGLLTILFIALKLLGYIKWSWVWVLAPLWGTFLMGIIAIIILAVWLTPKSRKGK